MSRVGSTGERRKLPSGVRDRALDANDFSALWLVSKTFNGSLNGLPVNSSHGHLVTRSTPHKQAHNIASSRIF